MKPQTVLAIFIVGIVTAVVIAATRAPFWAQTVASFTIGIIGGILLRMAERRQP